MLGLAAAWICSTHEFYSFNQNPQVDFIRMHSWKYVDDVYLYIHS